MVLTFVVRRIRLVLFAVSCLLILTRPLKLVNRLAVLLFAVVMLLSTMLLRLAIHTPPLFTLRALMANVLFLFSIRFTRLTYRNLLSITMLMTPGLTTPFVTQELVVVSLIVFLRRTLILCFIFTRKNIALMRFVVPPVILIHLPLRQLVLRVPTISHTPCVPLNLLSNAFF